MDALKFSEPRGSLLKTKDLRLKSDRLLGRYTERLLFRFGDPESLTDPLLWVFALEEQGRNAIGTYLREQLVKLHSLERLGAKLVGLLDETRKYVYGGFSWTGLSSEDAKTNCF